MHLQLLKKMKELEDFTKECLLDFLLKLVLQSFFLERINILKKILDFELIFKINILQKLHLI